MSNIWTRLGMSRRSFAVEKWMSQRHALGKAEAKFRDSKISLPEVAGQCKKSTKLRLAR